ncbi:FHA domain-containing protein [Kineosporia succinea]|uniref:FHA domain-containing protein n=1 Tax=Kineosporia succinea TaxID=84632 RepID=A0ABT9P898_9ACTN|nr:FHA domain-containing protein [Kineosporia succinea]MDP9828692.1 hypothetical protein [Kineosporia succinea]
MSIETSRTTIRPGTGIVHRGPGLALLIADPAHPGARALLDACTATAGRATLPALAARVGGTDLPPFALALEPPSGPAGSDDGGLVLLLHNAVEAEVHVSGRAPEILRGNDSLAWVERRFPSGVEGFHLRTAHTYPGTGSATAEGISLNLSRGTLLGSGLVVGRGDGSPASARDEVTAERPLVVPRSALTTEENLARTAPTVKAPLVRPPAHDRSYGSSLPPTPHLGQERLEPTPLRTPGGGLSVPRPNVAPIEGVLCARAHFTDPQASFCSLCGISMHQVSRTIVHRPRPALGVLVLDDGTSVTVDSDLIIGRDPGSHPAVRAGDARPMVLNDDIDGVSRVHARVTLVDWTACLTDEDSSNGTFLLGPQGARPVRGEVPVELTGGTTIRMGRRTMTYDAYHSGGR